MSVQAAEAAVRQAEAALAAAKAARADEREDAGYGLTISVDELVGSNLNAGEIMSTTTDALRQVGATRDQINAYRREAISGSYEHLCDVTRRWLTEGPPDGLPPAGGEA